MKFTYKSRDVSTADFMDDFEPPLTFRIKAKASEGWFTLVEQIEAEARDIDLAKKLLSGICFSVSDGDERASVDEFYQSLKEAAPEMADELFCDLAYGLAIEFIQDKRKRLAGLKKTSPVSNGSAKAKTPVSE